VLTQSGVKTSLQVQLENDIIGKKEPAFKMIFQKQSQDGAYKVSNNFIEEPLQLPNQNINSKMSNFSCKPSIEGSYKINNNF
jgi:hypothetical protein